MPESKASPTRWPALLTVGALAEYVGLSVSTIEKLQASDKLPKPVRIADVRATRWRREDIDQFISELPSE